MRAVPAALLIAYGAAAPAAGAAAAGSGAAPAAGSAAAPVRWDAGVARAAALRVVARGTIAFGVRTQRGVRAGATSTAECESIAVLTLANPDHAYGKATLEQVFRRLASPLAP